jgi:hypothetical protein
MRALRLYANGGPLLISLQLLGKPAARLPEHTATWHRVVRRFVSPHCYRHVATLPNAQN